MPELKKKEVISLFEIDVRQIEKAVKINLLTCIHNIISTQNNFKQDAIDYC